MPPKSRVLIVDDDELLQELVKIALEGEGYEVHQALTGAELWRVLASLKPDIIVLDVMLPDADGRELLAKLKSNPKTNSIPVMLWSARPRESDVDLDELGAEVFLQKGPTDTLPAELERVLMRISERIPIK